MKVQNISIRIVWKLCTNHVPTPIVAVTCVFSFGNEKIVPKSVIFACKVRSNKIFFALMSPCIIRGWRP